MPSLLRNNRAYSRDAKASVPVRGQTTHGCRASRAGHVSRRDVGHGCRHPPSRNAPRRNPNPAHRRPLTASRTDAAVQPERLSRPGRGGGDAWDRSTPRGLKRRGEINRWCHRGGANGSNCRWLRSGSPRGELPPNIDSASRQNGDLTTITTPPPVRQSTRPGRQATQCAA